jgi:hypothetical protein
MTWVSAAGHCVVSFPALEQHWLTLARCFGWEAYSMGLHCSSLLPERVCCTCGCATVPMQPRVVYRTPLCFLVHCPLLGSPPTFWCLVVHRPAQKQAARSGQMHFGAPPSSLLQHCPMSTCRCGRSRRWVLCVCHVCHVCHVYRVCQEAFSACMSPFRFSFSTLMLCLLRSRFF